MYVNIQWTGDQNFIATNNNNKEINIGTIKDDPNVITPPDLLLMSLGTCTGLFMMPAAKNLNIHIEDFNIQVKGIKAKEPPKLFDAIEIYVKIKGDLNKSQGEAIVKKAHDKCFILKSLNPNIEIISIIEMI
jgi:putative redox protein